MTVAVESIKHATLADEWLRIELLAASLLDHAQGRKTDPAAELAQLKTVQQQVMTLRSSHDSPWQALPVEGLNPLAVDVLCCVLAPEVRPAIARQFSQLHGDKEGCYASLWLIQHLLALSDQEFHQARMMISQGGELVSRQLIKTERDGVFAPIVSGPGVISRLLDMPTELPPPPGTWPVKTVATWDDLVLSKERQRMLQEFLLWFSHREKVEQEWGADPIGGPVALFSGPSGTGKTFAASVIAGQLGWPLYRVDLARLVSKYIGETEKNIGQLFDAANGRPMVLQFDEVDALMGKRGEVKEARDRYANMEVSYLLARIEQHQGPCILTTNLRSHIDKAFSRRFQMVVEFPRPDCAARAKLWRKLFPPKAPLAEQVEPLFLARAVNLTGGNIRNVTLHAAYLAAEDNSAIDYHHIAVAVYRELGKDRLQLNPADMGELARYLPTYIKRGEGA